MSQRFVISISADSSHAASATFMLDVQAGSIQVREIRVHCGDEASPLPPELANFDYSTFVSFASDLSRGQFPSPHTPNNHQKASNVADDGSGEPKAQSHILMSAGDVTATARGRRTAPVPKTGVPPDLARVYWAMGSIAKVAKHYDVPRHIAKDWVSELRAQRAIPTPWASGQPSRGIKDVGRGSSTR